MLAVIGLLPQLETAMETTAASELLPCASVAATRARKVSPATSAMNEGVAEVAGVSTAVLPAGLERDQLNVSAAEAAPQLPGVASTARSIRSPLNAVARSPLAVNRAFVNTGLEQAAMLK